LQVFDDEPIVPVVTEVTFMLDRLAPFLGGASGGATIEDTLA
jgi:hypothetical protein